MRFVKLLILIIFTTSCSVKYSLTGASISPETKTFQVNYFQNNAPLIEPGIERDFTNKLIDLLINQTSLELVKSNGDLTYEGEIVEYRISPTTATANNTAAQNRLTVGVNIRFYDRDNLNDFQDVFFNVWYGTSNINKASNLLIYPNPVRKTIYIEGDIMGYKYQLKNILGTNIKSSLSLTNRIDFSDVPKGTYFLLLEKENEKIVKQILVN
mgnify:CR=1 FL=1